MARAVFVKKAAKDYPDQGIKKGESYWWWKFRFGGKHYSKTAPRASQLTQSNFYSTVYGVQESLEDANKGEQGLTAEDVKTAIEDAANDLEGLQEETQGSLDNMPEGLQQGDTGQMLEERVGQLGEAVDALNSIDVPEEKEDEETDEDYQERLSQALEEAVEAVGQIS